MREFDANGLRLAEFQGRLFEKSADVFDCSTKVFLRRFFYSDLLKAIDKNDSVLLSLDPLEGLGEIESQFGKSDYGKTKWNPNVLFWIGYLYRYISYTRETETKFIMRLFPPDKLKDVYYAYHTQSNEWVVENLLSLAKVHESVFDKNFRLKEAIGRIDSSKRTNPRP
ncbi:MAG: hypothetical protein LKG11_00970 [Bacilli bacterium]|jgi:hypothetical protein|nr:hypothetical protein [Bacilli bacterium]